MMGQEHKMTPEGSATASPKVAFTAEMEAEFQDIVRRYPDRRAALIPVLHLAQESFEYLSPQVMEYVAERLEIPAAKVLQVATFYTMFKKRPSGRYHIEICTSVPCCMMGGYSTVRYLEQKLGIQAGETTPDKKFSLAQSECLAACGNAPVMQIDSIYYEKLTPELIDEILEHLP